MQQPGQGGGPAAAAVNEEISLQQRQLQLQQQLHLQQQLQQQQQYYYNKHFFPKYPPPQGRPMMAGLYGGSELGQFEPRLFNPAYNGPPPLNGLATGFKDKQPSSLYSNDLHRSPYNDEIKRQPQLNRSTPKEMIDAPNAPTPAAQPQDLAAALYFNKALKQQQHLQQQQQEFLMAAAAAAQYQQRLMLAGVSGVTPTGGLSPWPCGPITPYQLPHPFFGLPPFAPPLISSVVAPPSSVTGVAGAPPASVIPPSRMPPLASRESCYNNGPQHQPPSDPKFNPDQGPASNHLNSANNSSYKRPQIYGDPYNTNNNNVAKSSSNNTSRRVCNDEGLALKAKGPPGGPATLQELPPCYGSTLPYPNLTNPYYHLAPAPPYALNNGGGNKPEHHPTTPAACQIEFLRCLGVPAAYINSLNSLETPANRDYFGSPPSGPPKPAQPIQLRAQPAGQQRKSPALGPGAGGGGGKKQGFSAGLESSPNNNDPTFNPFALLKSRIIADIRTLDSCIETLEHKMETLAQNKNEISRELNYRFTKISPESAVHKSLTQCGKDLGDLEKRGDVIEHAWVWKDVLKRNQETATQSSSDTNSDLNSDTIIGLEGSDPPSQKILQQFLTPDPHRDNKMKVVLGVIKTQLRSKRKSFHEKFREFQEKYQQKMDAWKESVAKSKKLAKRRNKDAKVREFFENQFPELRDDRMEKERLKRIWTRNTMGNYARTETDVEEISKRLHEQEEEKKRLYRLSATIPRLLTSVERASERRCYYVDPHRVVQAGPTKLDALEQPASGRSSSTAPAQANNDPLTERAIRLRYVNVWGAEEREIFKQYYVSNPKEFGVISRHLPNKSTADCVLHYYLTKKEENYKKLIKKKVVKKRKITSKSQQNISGNNSSTVTCTASNNKILGRAHCKANTSNPSSSDPLQDSSDEAMVEMVDKPAAPAKPQNSPHTTPLKSANENLSLGTIDSGGSPTSQPLAISTPKESGKRRELSPSPLPNRSCRSPSKLSSPNLSLTKPGLLAQKRPNSEPKIPLSLDPSPAAYDPYDFGSTEQAVDLSGGHTTCSGGQSYRQSPPRSTHVGEQGIKRRVENDVCSVDGDDSKRGDLSSHERHKRFRYNDCPIETSPITTTTQTSPTTVNQREDPKSALNLAPINSNSAEHQVMDEERAAREAFLAALPKDEQDTTNTLRCHEISAAGGGGQDRNRFRHLPSGQDLLGAVIMHQINQTVDGADSIKLWNPLRRFTQSPASSYSSNGPSLSPPSLTARGEANIACEGSLSSQPPAGPSNAPSVSS